MEGLDRGEFLRKTARLGLAAAAGGALLDANSALAARTLGRAASARKALTGTLQVWVHQNPTYATVYNNLVKQFEKQHPGVTIKTLQIPYAQFESKSLIAFTSGSPPDIVKLGGWDIANYATKKLIAPADPHALGYGSLAQLKSAYAHGSLDAVSYDGTLYGLPIDYNTIFLYYRRDHFREAGLDPNKPPKTWEQVVEYAKKLTVRDAGGNLKRAGWAYWYDLPIWDFLNFLPLPAGLGGGLVDSSGKGILSKEAGIKALTWYSDLSNKWKVASPKFTDPNFNYGQIADGSASMTVSGNFAISFIEAESKPKLKLGKDFDVAPMPQWAHAKKKVTSGYSWAWLVASKSKNQALAWEFLRFLQQPARVDEQLKVSDLIIPIKNWQKLPAGRGKGPQIVAAETSYADYGPTLANWSQMAQQLSDNLVATALGSKSPQQAANDFDNAMKRIS